MLQTLLERCNRLRLAPVVCPVASPVSLVLSHSPMDRLQQAALGHSPIPLLIPHELGDPGVVKESWLKSNFLTANAIKTLQKLSSWP